MERSDLPTADTSRTSPYLHQARAGTARTTRERPGARWPGHSGGRALLSFSSLKYALEYCTYVQYSRCYFLSYS